MLVKLCQAFVISICRESASVIVENMKNMARLQSERLCRFRSVWITVSPDILTNATMCSMWML